MPPSDNRPPKKLPQSRQKKKAHKATMRQFDQGFEGLTPDQQQSALSLLYEYLFGRGKPKGGSDIGTPRVKKS